MPAAITDTIDDAKRAALEVLLYNARDGRGGLDLQSYTLNVRPLNLAPVFSTEPVVTAGAGIAYEYRARAQDPDDDAIPVTLRSAELPDFLDS